MTTQMPTRLENLLQTLREEGFPDLPLPAPPAAWAGAILVHHRERPPVVVFNHTGCELRAGFKAAMSVCIRVQVEPPAPLTAEKPAPAVEHPLANRSVIQYFADQRTPVHLVTDADGWVRERPGPRPFLLLLPPEAFVPRPGNDSQRRGELPEAGGRPAASAAEKPCRGGLPLRPDSTSGMLTDPAHGACLLASWTPGRTPSRSGPATGEIHVSCCDGTPLPNSPFTLSWYDEDGNETRSLQARTAADGTLVLPGPGDGPRPTWGTLVELEVPIPPPNAQEADEPDAAADPDEGSAPGEPAPEAQILFWDVAEKLVEDRKDRLRTQLADPDARIWSFDRVARRAWTVEAKAECLAWAQFHLETLCSAERSLTEEERNRLSYWIDADQTVLWAALRDRHVADGESVAAVLCRPRVSARKMIRALPVLEGVGPADALTVGQVVDCIRRYQVVPCRDDQASASQFRSLVAPGITDEDREHLLQKGWWADYAHGRWGAMDYRQTVALRLAIRRDDLGERLSPGAFFSTAWELGPDHQAASSGSVTIPFRGTEAVLRLETGPAHDLRLTFEGHTDQKVLQVAVQHTPTGEWTIEDVPRDQPLRVFKGKPVRLWDIRVLTRGP
jgi:hypothetical protein